MHVPFPPLPVGGANPPHTYWIPRMCTSAVHEAHVTVPVTGCRTPQAGLHACVCVCVVLPHGAPHQAPYHTPPPPYCSHSADSRGPSGGCQASLISPVSLSPLPDMQAQSVSRVRVPVGTSRPKTLAASKTPEWGARPDSPSVLPFFTLSRACESLLLVQAPLASKTPEWGAKPVPSPIFY